MSARELQDEDIEAVASLLKSMWLMHVDKEPRLLNRDYIQEYDAVGYVKKYHEDSSHQFFVVEDAGKIVAAARVELMKFNDMHAFKTLGYLDDLVVDPGYRRQGVADELTEKRIEWAKKHGAEACQSKIYAFNKEAQGLAEKHGFEDVYHFYYRFFD